MREIRLYGSEGGEAFNPLSLPLSSVRYSPRSICPLTTFLRPFASVRSDVS